MDKTNQQMKNIDILSRRLINQQLEVPAFTSPTALLKWMGCIQAQDYAAAKWAIGCRLDGATDAGIETLFNEGKILRTHVLRPTWHFVLPQDIRWMLKLTAPGIRMFCNPYHRRLGIDDPVLKKSKSILEKALGKQGKMTRTELAGLLEKGKIDTGDGRIGFLLLDAELEGLICSGGRNGKQFVYALLADRAPKGNTLHEEEALARLAKIYFSSRGPATAADFAWWSGQSKTEAGKAIEMNRKFLEKEVVGSNTYWFSSTSAPAGSSGTSLPHPSERIGGHTSAGTLTGSSVHLLPAFDEYAISYKDRQSLFLPGASVLSGSGLRPILVNKGRITGVWKRTAKKGKILIETRLVPQTTKPAVKGFDRVCKKYADFLSDTPVE